MIILFHAVAALVSIILTTLTFIHPTKNKLMASYVLAAFTLTTGTYLIVTTPSHLVQSCVMGITYFAIVTTVLFAARRKFAHSSV